MDWLDQQLYRLRQRASSLQASLTAYLFLGSAAVTAAWLMTAAICISWQRLLLGVAETLDFWSFFQWRYGLPLPAELAPVMRLLEVLRYGSLAVYAAGGLLLVPRWFYRGKLQPPLVVIQEGIDKIKGGSLGEAVDYRGSAEFAAFAEQFNEMRISLKDSQAEIQRLHQEQRQLNGAFSHDLRTPLTVIRQNIELVEIFYDDGRLTAAQLREIFAKIKNNTDRLSAFAETMRSLQRIDEVPVLRQSQSLQRLSVEIEHLGASLAEALFSLQLEVPEAAVGSFDRQIILEVCENLLTNAIRFAKKEIQLTLQLQDDFLYVFVKDDGPGFSKEALTQAVQPYYSQNKQEHFGLGLTICQALVTKHGGVLKLANGAAGGGVAVAVFAV